MVWNIKTLQEWILVTLFANRTLSSGHQLPCRDVHWYPQTEKSPTRDDCYPDCVDHYILSSHSRSPATYIIYRLQSELSLKTLKPRLLLWATFGSKLLITLVSEDANTFFDVVLLCVNLINLIAFSFQLSGVQGKKSVHFNNLVENEHKVKFRPLCSYLLKN